MQTGNPTVCARLRLRGFTYLVMLFVLAAGSAGLASLATAWTNAAQRQLELESRFRGQEIANAIGRYRALPLAGGTADTHQQPQQGPVALEDLLDDPRTPTLQRHLRRLYQDPLTGSADWVLLRDARGHITALHSRSRRPALVTSGMEPRADGRPLIASDWVFGPPATAAASSAPGADGPPDAAFPTPRQLLVVRPVRRP